MGLLEGAVVDQDVDDGRIGECRSVTESIEFIGRDLAKDTAHDLA